MVVQSGEQKHSLVVPQVSLGPDGLRGPPGFGVLNSLQDSPSWGSLSGSAVEHLPLAEGVILESQDQVPHQAPCMEPASPLSVSLPLSISVSHE